MVFFGNWPRLWQWVATDLWLTPPTAAGPLVTWAQRDNALRGIAQPDCG